MDRVALGLLSLLFVGCDDLVPFGPDEGPDETPVETPVETPEVPDEVDEEAAAEAELQLRIADVLALVGDAAPGKLVYEGAAECIDCHGYNGDGLALDAEIDLRVSVREQTDEALLRAILAGVDDSVMVPFGGFLSPQETANVLAHLHVLAE